MVTDQCFIFIYIRVFRHMLPTKQTIIYLPHQADFIKFPDNFRATLFCKANRPGLQLNGPTCATSGTTTRWLGVWAVRGGGRRRERLRKGPHGGCAHHAHGRVRVGAAIAAFRIDERREEKRTHMNKKPRRGGRRRLRPFPRVKV
jgi:hypothetical protein